MAKRVTKITNQKVILTWEEALKGFLFWKQAQGISKRTYADYKDHVQRFFKRFPDSWQSTKLKHSLLEYFSDDIKPVTFNLRLIYLRAFFDWAINEGHLADINPLREFKKRKEQARIVDLSEDTLRQLLTLPDQQTFAGLRDYALILLTLDTGIRPTEALSLTINQLDLKHFGITVSAEIAKTRTTRTLPILPPTAETIKKLISFRPPSWGNSVTVFCSNEGTTLSRHTWGIGWKCTVRNLASKFAPMIYVIHSHCFTLGMAVMPSDFKKRLVIQT
ncbi:hypothetical protein N752_27805 [Desulforamulus aquiferis]|nr:tyrosine-type recombinase/integrase [Desulforamulus aquiferis]RYD01932.1 hypothetical protein N752_27805 [Desulforamulus aquiferis]